MQMLVRLAASKRSDESESSQAELNAVHRDLNDPTTVLVRHSKLASVLLQAYPYSSNVKNISELSRRQIKELSEDIDTEFKSTPTPVSAFSLGLFAEWYDYDFNRALYFYRTAHALDPSVSKYLISEARARYMIGDFDDAE